MTKFEKNLNGLNGEFWKRIAQEEISSMIERVNKDMIAIDENCAAYWTSNGHYLPADCVEVLKYAGFFFDEEATNKAREAQNAEFIENYRKNYTSPSAEELYEMRAAFGTGVTVVDVITGREIEL